MKSALLAALVAAAVLPGAPAAAAMPEVSTLAPLPGDTSTEASEMNDSGVVVGQSYGDDLQSQAVRWDRSGAHALPDLGHGSFAAAVNRRGAVAGYAQNATGQAQPVRWSTSGRLTVLAVPGATLAYARDINDSGTIAGTAVINEVSRAVRWDSAGRVTVLPLTEGADGSSGLVVSNRGDVLGQTTKLGQDSRAVRWDASGRATSFGPQSAAKAMNSRGTAVGRLGRRAIRWDSAAPEQLPSESFSNAYGVSASGYVAGSTGRRAALWDARNRITELPALPGQTLSGALAVNDDGVAVGLSGRFPVRWVKKVVTELPPLPGHGSASVIAVDDEGDALGVSYDPQGNPTAVVWRCTSR